MNPLNLGSWETGIAILEDNVFEKKLLPEGSPYAERRKETRIAVSVPLRHRIKGLATRWRSSESIDVSNTGIRLATTIRTLVGARVELDVRLPDTRKSMRINGVVVWVGPSPNADAVFECGVAFENLKKLTGKEKLIYFIADRLCEVAIKYTPKDFYCQPAETKEDLKAAFRLIYREYQRRGYCKPNPSKMHYSFYSMLPESRTFLLKQNEKVLGTLSLIVDSPCGLPIESVFPEQIAEIRQNRRRMAEVSLLALDQEAFQKKSFSLTDFQKLTGAFRLFKLLFDYARFVGQVSDLVIAVHPKHENLYRYLTFEIMAAPRSYAGACGKPALPMRLDIARAMAQVPPGSVLSRYFVNQLTPADLLTKHYRWTPPTLREFLMELIPLWEKTPLPHRQYFQSRYPGFEP